MTGSSIRDPREESIVDMWLFIIVNTTILVFLINILSISYGTSDVAAHLFYLPIVIAAYWYPNRGMLFGFIVSGCYFLMIFVITGGAPLLLVSALIKCVVFVGVAAVVSSLAMHLQKNEIKYRGIFNYSEAGTGLINRKDLSIIETNQRFAALLGYSADEISHVSFTDLWVDGNGKNQFLSQLDRIGSLATMESRLYTRDGGIRWVLLSAGMLPDDQFVCTIVDITDRKRAEESLTIKDHAIRSSLNAVAMFDLEYRITFVNQSMLRMAGSVSEQEFTGRSIKEFISSEKKFAEITAALSTKGSWLGELLMLRMDQTQYYAMVWVNIVNDNQNKPVCIMASLIDITDRKQMQVAKMKALEQIEKNIEQFAILGDHIRNPLTVIVGIASFTTDEIAEKIIKQANEIDRIITRLDMSWIESEKVREFIRRYYKVGAREIEESEPPGVITTIDDFSE